VFIEFFSQIGKYLYNSLKIYSSICFLLSIFKEILCLQEKNSSPKSQPTTKRDADEIENLIFKGQQ